jgi:adhesin transport system membrane fusion protein
MTKKNDTEFMRDLYAAAESRPNMAANMLLFGIIAFVVVFFIWSSFAKVEEVSRGTGSVIPSSQVQIVQNLEGGIVSKLLVKEGDRVQNGQVLVVIDDTQFRSRFGEDSVKRQTLQAMATRLKAEIEGEMPIFSLELSEQEPNLIRNQLNLFHARAAELNKGLAVLESQREQKGLQIKSLESKVKQLRESYNLGVEEVEITKPFVESGSTPKIELIRLKREINNIENSLIEAQIAIPQAKSGLAEITSRIEEKKAAFRSQAMNELNDTEAKLKNLHEVMLASEDRLERTKVLSPVDGTVKQVLITTLGGVITPGMNIVEIVPDDDTLLIEAKVKPSDVAFLHPDQNAKVKITAYDYTIYGTLNGVVEQISADTIMDHTGQSFYKVLVRAEKGGLSKTNEDLKILPGMVAEVDILTGKRTVLTYLLKPILRAKGRAFRER